jgi:hypothetical protein
MKIALGEKPHIGTSILPTWYIQGHERNLKSWGQYYDHNFVRCPPILHEKNGVFFLKKRCYDPIVAKLAVF